MALAFIATGARLSAVKERGERLTFVVGDLLGQGRKQVGIAGLAMVESTSDLLCLCECLHRSHCRLMVYLLGFQYA